MSNSCRKQDQDVRALPKRFLSTLSSPPLTSRLSRMMIQAPCHIINQGDMLFKWTFPIAMKTCVTFHFHQQPNPPGGVVNKCLYGEALPSGSTHYSLIYNLSRKRYPFRIPSIEEWYPFHIPCIELCIPFSCCKCINFYVGINHKNSTFSRLFKAIKLICQPFYRPK